MKKLIAFTSAAVAATTLIAAPQVSNVTMTQDASRTVTITYDLAGEDGIVTVDIQTNTQANALGEWVSIGGKHLTYFAGDVNKKVAKGTSRKATWKPRKAWPDNAVTENVRAVLSAWALNAPPDYMVVSLVASTPTVFYYTCAESVPYGVTDNRYKTEYLVMRKIPAANVHWRMGSPSTESGRNWNEYPHVVSLDNDFYIGIYPMTQRQHVNLYKNWFPKEATTKRGDMYPFTGASFADVRGGSWPNDNDALPETCLIYSFRQKTGIDFDLPLEAQWEFACRAGSGGPLYNVKNPDGTISEETSVGNIAVMGAEEYSEVGTKKPNAWGLYDMLGEVSELLRDNWADDLTDVNPNFGPSQNDGTYHAIRPSNWGSDAANARCARRLRQYDGRQAHIGYRVVCPAVAVH